MVKNRSLLIIKKSVLILFKMIGMGISRTISMSKTMKITARRKKRMENGVRADRVGSNPHSNGDIFSRFEFIVRVFVSQDSKYRRGGTRSVVIEEIRRKFILSEIYKFSYD